MTNEQCTVVSLREHLEQRITDLHRIVEEKFAAHRIALELATENLNKELNHLNRLREAVVEQRNQFMPRTEIVLQLEGIKSELAVLRKSKDQLEGKASMKSVMLVGLGTIISYMLTAVMLIVHLVK